MSLRSETLFKIRSAYIDEGGDPISFSKKYSEKCDIPEKEILRYISPFVSPKRSKGEIAMEDILGDIFKGKAIKQQYVIDNHRLDFYIPSIRLAVEYDGVQHYKQNSLFHGEGAAGRQKFENQIESDRKKNELCKSMNIYMLRIKYNEELSINNVRRIIDDNMDKIVLNLSTYNTKFGLWEKNL